MGPRSSSRDDGIDELALADDVSVAIATASDENIYLVAIRVAGADASAWEARLVQRSPGLGRAQVAGRDVLVGDVVVGAETPIEVLHLPVYFFAIDDTLYGVGAEASLGEQAVRQIDAR